jgi:hypothetical protein
VIINTEAPMPIRLLALSAGLAAALPAAAQSRFIIADRATDSLFSIWDKNLNGVIEEPDEVSLFFSGANTAGTLGPQNPTALAIRADGLVAMGDQLNRNVYLLFDHNQDGDAQDLFESAVVADASNASGVSFAFPTGAAFDHQGRLYIVNAGNAFGNDGVYRLVDLNGDGDFQDEGEITVFIGEPVFGPGNGPWSPQEIVIHPSGPIVRGYLRNSSAGLHGVYAFADLDGNGRADDPGEFTTYFSSANQSGVTLSAGFAIDIDAVRPNAVYMLQIATGGVDELYRLTDLNEDGDAQDPGEAVLVFSTAEPFAGVDVISLSSGQVLITDNSGKRVIVLTDLDSDGLFISPGERADYFPNSVPTVTDIRQINAIPPVCQANCDGSTSPPVLNVADFTCFLQKFAAGDPYANCDSSTSAPVLNVADFTCFLAKFAGGC